jgi:hypothetical protein
METNKSLDEVNIIATLLHDISMMHGAVFNTRAANLTISKVRARCRSEGMSFLTKTLPKVGKALDRALSSEQTIDCTKLGFKPYLGTKLPRFLGELFSRVFDSSGSLLPEPCVTCVKYIRQVCYLFYKYELPYTAEQERKVVEQFVRAEDDLAGLDQLFANISKHLDQIATKRRSRDICRTNIDVAREARILLARVFANFDPMDIVPRHGPGVVATKQLRSGKFVWRNVSKRITDVYPFDAYFCASLGHVCDTSPTFDKVGEVDLPARVLLVPKDSRGPRLISAEPVDFQWIQQGLRDAIYRLVESHPLTRNDIYFTDQVPNRIGALYGSSSGRYATLDLKEASDRVHLDLVRLLFPSHVFRAIEAARSQQTQLPDKSIITLRKFAPMGSALCFPIMALTIWALLKCGLCDTVQHSENYEELHVYGDDVIVPTAQAARAIELLESFGLLVNRDKSCTYGFFRESCGMDAFKGSDVTPVRIRTVWSSSSSASVYSSWISYANSFFDKRFFGVYDYIVRSLVAVYTTIPGEDQVGKTCPSLRGGSANGMPIKTRYNPHLQRREYYVRVVKAVQSCEPISGWSMLLRYFTEGSRPPHDGSDLNLPEGVQPFSVRSYTKRRASMLVRRWR